MQFIELKHGLLNLEQVTKITKHFNFHGQHEGYEAHTADETSHEGYTTFLYITDEEYVELKKRLLTPVLIRYQAP